MRIRVRSKLARLRVPMDHQSARELSKWAELAMLPRDELVGRIIRAWLANVDASIAVNLTARNLAQVPSGARVVLEQRLDALAAWKDARVRAANRGLSVNGAADTAIASLRRRGLKVSRTQLYVWDRSYRARGLVGLLDRRRPGGKGEAVRSAIEARSNDNLKRKTANGR